LRPGFATGESQRPGLRLFCSKPGSKEIWALRLIQYPTKTVPRSSTRAPRVGNTFLYDFPLKSSDVISRPPRACSCSVADLFHSWRGKFETYRLKNVKITTFSRLLLRRFKLFIKVNVHEVQQYADYTAVKG